MYDTFGSPGTSILALKRVRFAHHQANTPSKIAQLQDARRGIQEQILGLDVAMADADGVNVGQ
jgi:hypothetical protein